ncbi:MAG TPA: PRC-barrel domain-containing protein [Candidatus Binatia bacterium]|nr:PRC-barrel domain-containing protein [Candidatus Binatia bacterium]
MKKMMPRLLLVAAGGALLAVTAFAQLEGTGENSSGTSPSSVEAVPAQPHAQSPAPSPAQPRSTLTPDTPAPGQTLVSISGLVGTAVKNTQGETLGEIRELMIDHQSGRIVYAMVTCSGVFGMRQKTLAIPWETLKVGLNQTEVVAELRNDQPSPPVALSQR